MRRAVLLAHPAGHSLSPELHDAAFRSCGIDARYEAWDVPPDELASAVRRIREDTDVLGANVTVPHKRAVLAHLDGATEAATAIGAVNTIRREADRLVGDNTDGIGFLRALEEAGCDPAGRVALLFGAGGAARAVAWALASAGAAEIRIVNRTARTARELAASLAAATRAGSGIVRAVASAHGAAGPEVDLFVNATSLGMMRGGVAPDESPAPPGVFRAGAAERSEPRLAIDLVYRPRRTRFLRDAAAAGAATADGVGMLVHQGAEAFEIWTGRTAPVDAMRAALEAALAREEDA